jgi:hypothetical protein
LAIERGIFFISPNTRRAAEASERARAAKPQPSVVLLRALSAERKTKRKQKIKPINVMGISRRFAFSPPHSLFLPCHCAFASDPELREGPGRRERVKRITKGNRRVRRKCIYGNLDRKGFNDVTESPGSSDKILLKFYSNFTTRFVVLR